MSGARPSAGGSGVGGSDAGAGNETPSAAPLRKIDWRWRLSIAAWVIGVAQALIAAALLLDKTGEVAEAVVSGAWLAILSTVAAVIAGGSIEAIQQLRGGR